jgi:D-galactarolactone cycloisomerase
MLVKDIRVHYLEADLPPQHQFAYAQAWSRRRRAIFCEVESDTGLVGWGEAYPGAGSAVRTIIDEVYRPLILGEDPWDSEMLWDRCYQRLRDQGRKGVAIVALSALDIALWDLKGQDARRPIWKMAGGRYRDQVRGYATGLYHIAGEDPLAALAERVRQLVAAGFRALKIGGGFGLAQDVARVRTVREAVGPDVQLMVDANQAYAAGEAIQLARAIERYDITWLEEPVPPEDLAGYRRVRASVGIPIAGGEAEYAHYGIRELIAAEAVDILQPDITITGGFTAYRRILALAQAHDMAVCPHGWVSAVGLLANLQLCAIIPPIPPRLFGPGLVLELDQTFNPFGMELIEGPPLIRGDLVSIPEGPGLGGAVRLGATMGITS